MIYLLLIASTGVGVLLALLFRDRVQSQLPSLLALSGGFLFSATLSEMLPESYSALGARAALWIVVGLVIQIAIAFFSKGFEHGHPHSLTGNSGCSVIIALFVHALFDGIPARANPHFFSAILLHKIPISFMLAALLVSERVSKAELAASLLLFAWAAPLGAYLSTLQALQAHRYVAFAIASGVFLHLSSTILFESTTEDHKISPRRALALLVGLALGLIGA